MRQIIYKPVHGSLETTNCAGVALPPGIPVSVTDEQAELLLRNQFMVDAATGKNPNFTCVHCGAETNHDGVFDAVLANTQNSPIKKLVDDDGKRTCRDCIGAPVPVMQEPESVATSYSFDD